MFKWADETDLQSSSLALLVLGFPYRHLQTLYNNPSTDKDSYANFIS